MEQIDIFKMVLTQMVCNDQSIYDLLKIEKNILQEIGTNMRQIYQLA